MCEEKEALIAEENQRIRRFRVLVDLTRSVIYQDRSLTHSDARRMVIDLRRVASNLFPGKEGTFDLVLWPRFDRVLRERFGEGLDSSVH
jgi:hypothetical protein